MPAPDLTTNDGSDGTARPRTGKGLGAFFAVDRRAWARACELGLNPATAYLVLACGTGRNNGTTTWSVHAIETYTSISRGRARKALEALRQVGLVQVLREGTRPKYRLTPAHEVHGCEGCLPALDEQELRLLDWLRQGNKYPPNKTSPEWGYRNPRTIARGLVKKGMAREPITNLFEISDSALAAAEPDWIWLPNAIVTGAAGETPPVELVRQTQDAMTLRLLIDLYHAQNLREDGGIGRQLMRRQYERVKLGQHAQFTVWGFRYQGESASWSGPTRCHYRAKLTDQEKAAGANPGVDFFRRQGQLVRLGLIEWVPHLVEGDGPEAEIIHPLGTGTTTSVEDRLGRAAAEAAAEMLTEGQLVRAEVQDLHLVPVPHHVANVQLIGIARLRYRPRTRMTAAWWAGLLTRGERHLACYQELAGIEVEAMSA